MDDSGGVHLILGQTKGQIWSVVGGGLNESKIGQWGPLRWPENHHQVVVLLQQPVQPALQPCLRACGAHRKNGKNEVKLGSWSLAGGLHLEKSFNA